MHAATRHLYYQRALLQLLLRQLTFCVTELKGMMGLTVSKQLENVALRMNSFEMALQPIRPKRALLQQILSSHLIRHHLTGFTSRMSDRELARSLLLTRLLVRPAAQ